MLNRRQLLSGLAAVPLAGGVAGSSRLFALPVATVRPRIPWTDFVRSDDYPALVAAVRQMKRNRDPDDPEGWRFWARAHEKHCPHGSDYFLAWHRGFLHLFEQHIRQLTRRDHLRIPYWNYFQLSKVPHELAAGGSRNPFFERRKGLDVGAALLYRAFDPTLDKFQHGLGDCFESRLESCHNNIHNLIGGAMTTMQSPSDMVFWIHHANVDRLWAGWAARRPLAIPAADSPYWDGELEYGAGFKIGRRQVIDPALLGYSYENVELPAKPRPEPGKPSILLPPGAEIAEQRGAASKPPRRTASGDIALDEQSTTFVITKEKAPEYDPSRGHQDHRAAVGPVVILDAVALTESGREGGYFYKVYLDLPGFAGDPEERLLATFGPFQIAAALHHAEDGRVQISLPASDLLARLGEQRSDDLKISFVRVSATGAPEGDVITVGSVKLQS